MRALVETGALVGEPGLSRGTGPPSSSGATTCRPPGSAYRPLAPRGEAPAPDRSGYGYRGPPDLLQAVVELPERALA